MKLGTIYSALWIVGACQLASCGGSSGSAGLTDIASLPKATAAVSTSTSEPVIVRPVATTGVVLKNLGNIDWSGKSRGLCEAGAIAKNVLRETGTGDKILCYIGVMEANDLFTASYDGTDKYYTLAPGQGEDSGTLKVKFNITGTGGVITNFKMWTCEGGDTQTQYLSTTNTNGTIAMTSVNSQSGTREGMSYAFGNRATVAGAVTATGAWTSKTMTVRFQGQRGSGGTLETSSGYAQIVQAASSMTLSAFQLGSFQGNSFETSLYGAAEILGAGSLTTFAIGDGSTKYSATFTGQSSASGTTSWNGDSMAVLGDVTAGTYYSVANGGSLPTAEAQTITFDESADEDWDCSASSFTDIPAASFTSTVEAALAVCDATYAGDQDRSYVDCYSGN